jgi:hypothetical protein
MRFLIVLALFAAGCGKEIGDQCIVSADCDPNGTRICVDTDTGGYCTIQGCDVDTCPSESECVRFFTGQFDNKLCQSNADCSLDELCNLSGHCVARSSEVRYCMRKCSSDSDCNDHYECRKFRQNGSAAGATFEDHGGEPLVPPDKTIDEHTPGFCAAKPAS